MEHDPESKKTFLLAQVGERQSKHSSVGSADDDAVSTRPRIDGLFSSELSRQSKESRLDGDEDPLPDPLPAAKSSKQDNSKSSFLSSNEISEKESKDQSKDRQSFEHDRTSDETPSALPSFAANGAPNGRHCSDSRDCEFLPSTEISRCSKDSTLVPNTMPIRGST